MLRLDANEGRCILSEEDLREILSPEIARRYPMRELLEIPLAEKLGLPSSCVLATAGADDAIDRTIRSLAGPGGLIMSTSPGFVEFLEAAQRSSARFKEIKKDPFEPFPIDDICRCVRALTPRLLFCRAPIILLELFSPPSMSHRSPRSVRSLALSLSSMQPIRNFRYMDQRLSRR